MALGKRSSGPVPTLGGLAESLGTSAGNFAPVPIAGVTADSRAVRPGFVFVAIPGTRIDGAAFIPEAVAEGAVAIVGAGERPEGLDRIVAYLRVDDPRAAIGHAARYVHPRQPERIVAVTGTAGKTSVAEFSRQVFAALGHRAASLGTLGIITPEGADYGALTTPDPVTLHRHLDRLAGEGITHLAMEASSHGIDQRRLDGVRLSAAAFTNLGRDHLDYHADMESYFAAKLRLFEALLPQDAPAVINLDGARGAEAAVAAAFAGHRVITVGHNGADIRVVAVATERFGQRVRLAHAGMEREIVVPLAGAFQVENALVAAGLALAIGADAAAAFAALETLQGVPGRLERVGEIRGAAVFVDYAHKPDALKHVLATLRPSTSGRLVAIIGCGGDRDAGKRPIMGRIAAELADSVIVTDDNPRSEDPAVIRAAILAAAPGAIEIGDRAAAIEAGIAMLGPGDALVVAGKGHEMGQIVGGVTHPFSDRDAALAALAAASDGDAA